MGSRWSLTRGSTSGVSMPRSVMSRWYSAVKVAASSAADCPASALRAMILSSMSVTLRT